MIENLTNKTSYKKNKNDLCIDDVLIDKFLLSENPHDEKIIKSNILINSLQDFMKKCEASYDKLYYEKNYAISLNEIFTLIQNSIFSQQQLDNYIYNINTDNIESNINCIKILNEKFINDLNYNIISIEKINNNYYSFNKIKKNNTSKKLYNKKSLASHNNVKNKINSIFNNIYKEVFINGNEVVRDKNNLKEINTYNESIKSTKERSKSAVTNNTYPKKKTKKTKKEKNQESSNTSKAKISNGTSSKKDNIKKIDNKDNGTYKFMTMNDNINLSNYDKKVNTFSSREMSNNKLNRNSCLKENKTSKPSKYNKNIKKLDIFKVCQNMKKIKNGSTGPLARVNSSYYIHDLNDFNDSFLKQSLKSIGFSQINEKNNATIGIKKIIVSNAYRPTNFANHLLNKGKKCISDFKKMDNQENKRRKL